MALSPQGQQLAFGTAGPLLTRDGRLITANFQSSETKAALAGMPTIPQTDRWPLPGSGKLHPLDYIVIAGVQLPLASMPDGDQELDVSHRKPKGSHFTHLVSNGLKMSMVKIQLLLFRDQSQGYGGQGVNGKGGGAVIVGKDWVAEYDKIRPTLLASDVKKAGDAVTVFYPTLHAHGVDSLLFTKVGFPRRAHGMFFTVDLEGYSPKKEKAGTAKAVKTKARTLTTSENTKNLNKLSPQERRNILNPAAATPASKHRGK